MSFASRILAAACFGAIGVAGSGAVPEQPPQPAPRLIFPDGPKPQSAENVAAVLIVEKPPASREKGSVSLKAGQQPTGTREFPADHP